MKRLFILSAVLISCTGDHSVDEKQVETVIRNLHLSLKEAYITRSGDTDRLLDRYYDSTAYYVTPWATSETMDSTRSRLKAAVPRVTEYDFSIESMNVKTYGEGAIAFFVLRQDYKVDGVERSEYLPTTMVLEPRGDTWKVVHVHRSADPETWKQWFEPR